MSQTKNDDKNPTLILYKKVVILEQAFDSNPNLFSYRQKNCYSQKQENIFVNNSRLLLKWEKF